MDAVSNNQEHLQVQVTDDSCRHDELSLTKDTDGARTKECVSGDQSAAVRQENSADLKHESDHVCCVQCCTHVSYSSYFFNSCLWFSLSADHMHVINYIIVLCRSNSFWLLF